MASNDNPIDNLINDVLGLGHAPRTFNEKIEGLRKTFEMPPGEYDYIDAFRKDKGLSSLTYATSDSSFDALHQAGLVPRNARSFLSSNANNVYFDDSNNSLFYRKGNQVTKLPTRSPGGGVNFGGRVRKVNSYMSGSNVTSFIDHFYGALDPDDVARSAKQFMIGDMGKALSGGVEVRGVPTPEEAFWSSRRSILDRSSFPEFSSAFDNFQLYSSNMSMLAKTAGNRITPELEARVGNVGYGRAFNIIEGYKRDYVSSLSSLLTSTGNPTSYVFTKPEFLGHKDKVLMSSSQLTDRYGSRFESHILKKGAFQLAKTKATDPRLVSRLTSKGLESTAPFMLAGQNSADMYARMGLRVGVIDTTNNAFARMYFQEGGALLTASGSAKFAQHAPMGTLSFSSPSEKLIESIQDTFGVNLGAGNVQTLHNHPRNQLAAATDRDFRRILRASGKHAGLVEILSQENNRLSKIELTDSKLQLSFETPDLVTPHSSEINIAGVRNTAITLGENHPLRGIIPNEALEGIDVLVHAEDFNKNLGGDAFVTNFIEQAKGQKNAEAIFEQTFGHKAHVSMSGKRKTIIPLVTNADTAFIQATRMVRQMARGSKSQRAFAKQVLEGNSITIQNGLAKGVSSLRVVGLGGASRTDFMGDINMMKPITMSPTKMGHIAMGSRSLGYGNAYEDPLFSLLAGSNKAWRSKQIGISKSGRVTITGDHLMSRYSKALLGSPGTIDTSAIVTMADDGGFMMGDKRLRALPKMDMFSHSTGVDLSRLEGTLLGQSQDMLYLDLGKTRKLKLLGDKLEKSYRYIPIPLEYLRAKKGTHNRVVVGQNHPSHELLSSLVDIDHNRGFTKDPIGTFEKGLASGFFKLNKALAGKEGIFQKSNTLVMPLGTRARLAPQGGEFFNMASLDDVSKVYTTTVSIGDVEDYLTRKSGSGKAVSEQIDYIRGKLARKESFFAMVGVDPMQRAEHANVMKVAVDYTKKSKGIGQLNLSMHPFWFLLSERDVDRDAVNFMPLSGMQSDLSPAQLEKKLEERWLKQQKLSKHFMWFYKNELMQGTEPEAKVRFSSLRKAMLKGKAALQYLSTYLGISKSLGYSTIRASEPIMSELITNGAKAARAAGVTHKMASDEMLARIASPFLDDPIKGEATVKMFQNLYQGAIQKGATSPLEIFDKALVDIGQTYSGTSFDYDAVVSKTKAALTDLLQSSSKIRSFTDMDYLYNNFPAVKESLDLMKADLERGASYALASGKAAKDSIIDAMSTMMAQYLGPGQVLAASGANPKGVNTLLQQNISDTTTPYTVLKNMIEPTANISASEALPNNTGLLSSADSVAKVTEKKVTSEASESFAAKTVNYFKSSKGKVFGAGLGIGALLGAGIVSSMSGPEAPMPREVDGRQPLDMPPDVYSTPPKLYGNGQSFSASRRRLPDSMSSTQPYSFPSFGGSSMTIRDRRGSSSSHEIQRHMRDISNSDYVY